jgi:hypothetical protein
MALAEADFLEDWVSLPKAASLLGVTKQSVHYMITRDRFKTLHIIEGDGPRPLYVVRRSEVAEILSKRETDATAAEKEKETA